MTMQRQMEVNTMSKQSRVIVVSTALLIGFSGIAQADAVHHRGQAARTVRPSAEAILRKLPDQNVYGMAITKTQSSCNDITCPGYSLIGIGF
jgi:hypothetical protein